MILTTSQRQSAIPVAERLASSADQDVALLSAALLDSREWFGAVMPIYLAAMKFVTDRGLSDYAHWDELRDAVLSRKHHLTSPCTGGKEQGE